MPTLHCDRLLFGGGNDVGRYIRRLRSRRRLDEAVSIEIVHVLTQLIVASHSPMTLQCVAALADLTFQQLSENLYLECIKGGMTG